MDKTSAGLLPSLNWGDPVESDGEFLLPVGTVTMLLADVEGSTRQWEADESGMSGTMEELSQLVTDIIGEHEGVRPLEQGEGDSFVAAFARASEAASCAIAIQDKLRGSRVRLRIGIHSGEARRGAAKTYVGPTVNRTARLRDAGHGGQIVVSNATAELLADAVPEGAWLLDLGSHRLKDLARPERIYQLMHPGAPTDLPPLRTLDSYRHNLPEQRTPLFGRTQDAAHLCDLLATERLVTLHGGGGSGKTRLALHVAAQVLDGYPDGVFFVDLSSARSADDVGDSVLDALSLQAEARTVLATYLAGKRLLLVLDNCEHVVAACAELIDHLLSTAPEFQVLATSREPVGVPGEITYRVPSLPAPPATPAGIEALAPYAAAELFVDRARRVNPDYEPTDTDAQAIAEICIRLDGVPLAIELAAARTRAMTPSEVADGLHERFRLLTGGARTALARQQTLRASVDWSYALLSETERAVFRRLAVFVGGFTLDAARTVAQDDTIAGHHVVDLLALLVEKSLVVLAESDSGGTRYRLLETVRQYALEMLEASDEAETTRLRHRDHFAAISTTDPSPAMVAGRRIWLAQEVDNLWEAYRFCTECDDVEELGQVAIGLQWHLWFTSKNADLSQVVTNAARLTTPTRIQLAALAAVRGRAEAALLAHAASDRAWFVDHGLLTRADLVDVLLLGETGGGNAMSLDELEAAVQRAEAAGDLLAELTISTRLSVNVEWMAPDVDTGPYWHRYLQRMRRFGPDAEHGVAAGRASNLAKKGAAHEALALLDSVGDRLSGRQRAWAAVDRGACLISLGRVDDAEVLLDEGTRLATELDLRDVVGTALFRRGLARMLEGDAAGAVDNYTASIDELSAVATAFLAPTIARVYGDLADAYVIIGDFDAAGRALERGRPLAFAPWIQSFLERPAAALARTRDDFEATETAAHLTLAGAAPYSFIRNITAALELLAGLAVVADDHAEAARIMGAAQALRDDQGDLARFAPYAGWYDADVAAARTVLGDAAFRVAWDEGSAMPWREAVAYVQRGRGHRKRPSSGWASLTPTERQVVDLVADGLSNQDIGTRMFISARTVGSHLTHVYAKLDIASRTELVAEKHRRAASTTEG